LRWRLALLLICAILAILFLGSPFVLLVLPLAWFLDRMASGHAVWGIVAAGVPVFGIVAIALTRLSTRFADILSGRDGSFFVRFQGPYEVALKSIEQYPIFGVGIGAKPALFGYMDVVYSSLEPSWHDHRLYLLVNAFANSLSFFGVAGAAIFYFLVAQWAKGFGIKVLVSLSLETLRMWGSIAVVLGCYAMASGSNARQTEEVRPGVP
jgi:O-antigen ligase